MLKKEEIFVDIQNKKELDKVTKLLKSFGQRLEFIGWEHMRCAHFYENSWCVPERSYIEKLKTKVSIQELKNILAFEFLKEGDVIIFSGGTSGFLWIAEFERFIPSRGINLPLSIKIKRYNALHKESRYKHGTSGEKIHGSFVRFATDGEKRALGVKTDPTQSSFECDCSGLVDHINRLGNDINNIPALIKASIHPSIGSGPMYYKGNKIEKGSVIYINSDGHPELYESKEDFLNEVKINEEWPVKPQVFKKDQIIESLNDAYKSMADSCTLETMFVRNALFNAMDYITAMPDKK